MPNWKSYESSVRLLSAILAAHPELKLNYQEISRCFGGDSTRWAIDNRFRGIKLDAKKIREALDAGIDPSTVEVGATNGGSASKVISDRYGGDCTGSAIDNRLRVVKSDAKRINDAFGKGIDPITLIVGVKEVSKYFGSDGPSSTIMSQMKKIKAHVNRVKTAVDAGIDPLTIEIVVGWAISTNFGGGCTHRAVESKMLKMKNTIVKNIREAVAAGVDPITVDIDPKCSRDHFQISKYYGDSTPVALEHRFRPIKQLAKDLRAGIADKLDDGTTAKAVSSRIDRVKKEAGSVSNGASKGPRTPSKPKAKKTGLISPSDGSEILDDDEEMLEIKSPISEKKSALNRTQTGRISKSTPNHKVASKPSYPEFGDGDLEDDDVDIIEVKKEAFVSANRQSNGSMAHSRSTVLTPNGHSSPFTSKSYANTRDMGYADEQDQGSSYGSNQYQQLYATDDEDEYVC